MHYALLQYSLSKNIGDEIQSIAAQQFLPRIDVLIDRDHLVDCKPREPTKIILNGWFSHRPKNMAINHNVLPLFTSFHISNEYNSSIEQLTNDRCIESYKRFEPIGCRDLATMRILETKGIRCYFSGCLTLTLKKKFTERRNDAIYFVDVPQEVVPAFPKDISTQVKQVSHFRPNLSSFRKMLKAQEMLDAYAQAKMVVTTRLHCALPCLAFGTPVLFVTDNPKDPRFEGMLELMRHCSGRELHKETLIDWHHPTPNPADIGKFRSSLETICKTFVAQA